MKESLNNIKDLTSQIYPPAGAERIASQLHQADKEFGEIFPDVEPGRILIDSIKSDVAASLRTRRQQRWAWRSVAVAASLVFAAVVSVRMFITPGQVVPGLQESVSVAVLPSVEIRKMSWDQSDELSELSTSIDNIESAFYASEYDFSDADTNIVEIETQVNEMKELFWKG